MSTWLQAAGLGAVTLGVAAIYWPAGIIVGGVSLLLAGIAVAGER